MNKREVIWKIDEESETLKTLIDERGKNFFYYLNMLKLEKEPNILVLSPIHHYYYDFTELKKVNVVIQIKELNRFSDINDFLRSVKTNISAKAHFIGCFHDDKIYINNIIDRMRIVDWLLNKLDGKPYRYLSRKRIIKIFEKHNFKIMDITEFDQLTYFDIKKNND